jgi:prepilin-type N-terminal cleavage/methylation domain-containing protein
MRSSRQSTARAGFSLVEMLIVALILSLTLGVVGMVARSSDRAFQTGTTAADLELQVAQAMERIVVELRPAVLGTLAPQPLPTLGADGIQYLHALDFVAGEVVTSPLRRLAFEYAEGELDDGLDNNSNGLIDEGRVVLTEDLGGPLERRIVLTRWVAEHFEGELDNGLDDNGNGLEDERGFHVELVGETLFVRLTLERRDAQQRGLLRTGRTSTRLRN